MFNYDIIDDILTQTGFIFINRDSKIVPDTSMHVIYYSNGDRRLLSSTTANGAGGVYDILHKLETSVDVLSTGTHIISGMSILNLPGETGLNPGVLDGMLVYDSINSRWLIAYIITEDTGFPGTAFYPAAAYSTDLSSWTLIDKDDGGIGGYRGAKIFNHDGDLYIVAGGPDGSGDTIRLYDSSLVFQGNLGITLEGAANTNPHPAMVVDDSSWVYVITNDDTKYASGNFTWGNFQLFRASRLNL